MKIPIQFIETQPVAIHSQSKSAFGEVISSYSRSQAVADGEQIDVSKTAQEAGFRLPVLLTRAVFDNYVALPQGVEGQSEAGRLWNIMLALRVALIRTHHGKDHVSLAAYVRNDNRKPKLVKLIAACGPLDLDDPQPTITLMMEDES
jgi:hypothetical protein